MGINVFIELSKRKRMADYINPHLVLKKTDKTTDSERVNKTKKGY